MVSLADILALAKVRELADEKTFARGKAYFHDGTVSRLDASDAVVRASVHGAHVYEALEVVLHMQQLHTRLKAQAVFAAELEQIRDEYRAKRNFIKLLAGI